MKAKQLVSDIQEVIGGTFGRMAKTFKTGFERSAKVDYDELDQDLFKKYDKGGHDYDIRTRKAGFGRDFEDILGMKYSKLPSHGTGGEPSLSSLSSLQRNAEKFKWQSAAPEQLAHFVAQRIARDSSIGEKTLIALWAILSDFNDINRKFGSRSKEITNVEKAIKYVAEKTGIDVNDASVVRKLEKQAKYFDIHKASI